MQLIGDMQGHPNCITGALGVRPLCLYVDFFCCCCCCCYRDDMFVCCCLYWLMLAKCFSAPYTSPTLPTGKYRVSMLGSTGQQCDSDWVDVTLKVVKEMHCTQLQFRSSTSLTGTPPPHPHPPMLISVVEFNMSTSECITQRKLYYPNPTPKPAIVHSTIQLPLV